MSNGKHIPKVAVITRTKDRGLLLERAIKSVHQQTMEDFVHVIINDAGDPAIVEDLVKKHEQLIRGRVKIIHNTESRGMEAASNKAIKSVDSTFIAIHDDDDTWHPDFLKATTERLEDNGMQGVVVTTDRVVEDIIDDVVHIKLVERWLPWAKAINFYSMCIDNYATPITFLYRRAVYDKIGYYDENLPVLGDWDFALRFIRLHDIDFINSDTALAYYHHRPNVKGINGNSVFAGIDKHEYYLNQVANKFLREDLQRGSLGFGYMFSHLRAQRDNRRDMERQLEKIECQTQQLNQQVEEVRRTLGERTTGAHIKSLYRIAKKVPRLTLHKVKNTIKKAGRI
ncbi:glycosyltransferase family 2 protein [Candidatus Saccharibacteria bacterium]|nr:glycosyltransferase family 2 protein [Candidatus Saccharibacteria bacterium]